MENQDNELLFRIAKLVSENKELSKQVKEYSAKNEELSHLNEKLMSYLTPDQIEKGLLEECPSSKALKFRMTTILFADIQGFKDISESSDSQSMFDELDSIYFHFDQITEKYKIQKIKTIGDTYMCAGGVPIKNSTNPLDVVLAALEMQHYVEKLRENYGGDKSNFWQIKIGIHTGPVFATISGKKKISYELKGETVNIASRIQSTGELGKINVSVMTYELIKEYFTFEYYGKIPVKYQGDMEMYNLKRIKLAYSVDRTGIEPNDIFMTKYCLRQFTDLQEVILDRLEKELPVYLYYHNVKHTIDVLTQAELIGLGEGVTDEELLLLKTAGLFHDFGHIIGYDNHEYFGTQLAWEYLPKYGYNKQQIETICEVIMATKLPPKPETLLQNIICDSDLDYLGRTDFIPVSNNLYRELKEQNKIGSLNDWNKLQIKFISSHQYFTKTANSLREVNKQKQIDRIKLLIVE